MVAAVLLAAPLAAAAVAARLDGGGTERRVVVRNALVNVCGYVRQVRAVVVAVDLLKSNDVDTDTLAGGGVCGKRCTPTFSLTKVNSVAEETVMVLAATDVRLILMQYN